MHRRGQPCFHCGNCVSPHLYHSYSRYQFSGFPNVCHSRNVKEIKEILSASQRLEVYRWLFIADPSSLHNQVCSLYEPYTGNWVLDTQEWKDWVAGSEGCLWIHGIPGAGKTVLASYLIKNANTICHNSTGEGIFTCVYYYCHQRERNEAMPFLRWILSQLCRKADQVPASVHTLFKSGTDPATNEVLDGIEDRLDSFETVFIVLDAIDECNTWTDLLAALKALASPRFPKIRLIATSREYRQIEDTMKEISKTVSMDNKAVKRDIRLWVHSATARDGYISKWTPTLLDKVRNLLPDRAQGM